MVYGQNVDNEWNTQNCGLNSGMVLIVYFTRGREGDSFRGGLNVVLRGGGFWDGLNFVLYLWGILRWS